MLEDLFKKYGTDKGIWGYTPIYESLLGYQREKVEHVLEIGICGYRDIPNNVVGASLFAWRDYFPNAVINGIDNDSRFIFNDQDRIRTGWLNAYSPVMLADQLNIWGNPRYEFICDDAVHDPLPQLYLFKMLWGYLERGGIYAIEEACSYKCPNGNLASMVDIIEAMCEDADVRPYKSSRDEHLLIIRKRP